MQSMKARDPTMNKDLTVGDPQSVLWRSSIPDPKIPTSISTAQIMALKMQAV